MEEILDLYAQPAQMGVVYLAIDEKGKELQAEPRPAQPASPGRVRRVDSEYERRGSCNLFVAYNWHTRQRHIQVTERRRGEDWGAFLEYLATVCYPDCQRLVVVCDNLNIHDTAALYDLYRPEKARALAQRFEFHYTPTHASWLNMAEIELSALERQCLDRRISTVEAVAVEAAGWVARRNREGAGIEWQFSKEQARLKLGRAYPRVNEVAQPYQQLCFEGWLG